MSRNVFEGEDNPETFKVPLRLGLGGPVIGEAEVTADGQMISSTITDEEVKKRLEPPAFSFTLPSDRYKVSPQQDEMDVPYGYPSRCDCKKYQGCSVCRKYEK